ncbi:MAG: class I SAM-dependent methyltransferase [Bacteroidetes bacterium]|nr:class I SAM-dependent methyltransferase [Bacteroidota bacterium]
MKLLTSTWTDYELIDSGGLEKLERFGEYILGRPEPQAVWKKAMPEEEWQQEADAIYKRAKGVDPAKGEQSDKGEWIMKKRMPEQWRIGYDYNDLHLTLRLGLTAFGHIGVFPEQAENWNFIYDFLNSPVHQFTSSPAHIRVLNLFAYTGGSSLAAKAAGADVVHVDSVKPVITWGRENMEASGLKDIRWVVEDALKFVRREVKRGNMYHGIILDPPAYGRGPEGEKWILQDSIDEMIHLCSQLLEKQNSFFILSLYSMGFSALVSESLVNTHFGNTIEPDFGELFFADRNKRRLPLGTFLRFTL